MNAIRADVTDPQSVASVAAGADAVVSAVSARGVSYTLADVAPPLVEGLREAGVRRLLVVGGAGSLEVAPDKRLLDVPDFPEEWKPEAIAQSEALRKSFPVGSPRGFPRGQNDWKKWRFPGFS